MNTNELTEITRMIRLAWTVALGVGTARTFPTLQPLTLRACAATVGTAAEYLVDRLRCALGCRRAISWQHAFGLGL